MTILFLNPTGRIGGSETVLLEVLSGLAEAHPSWRLILIVASEGPLVARARGLGAVVRVLPFPAALARLGEWSASRRRWPRLTMAIGCGWVAWPVWRYLTRLRKVIEETGRDIVVQVRVAAPNEAAAVSFNAKFGPRWEPRYLVFEHRRGLPRIGLAAMRIEGQLPKLRS